MASVLVAGAVGAGVYALWPNAPEHALKYVDNTPEELAPPPTGAAFSVHPDKGLPIRYAASGIASQRFDPIPVVFKRAAERHKNNIAFRIEKPGYKNNAPGEWVDTTWSEYYAQSRSFAKALVATGHKEYQSVAICGFNHPAWFASHCGVILACGLSAGTYTTNSPDACAFVASDSLAHVAVVDTAANAKKYWVKRAEIPTMKYIVIYNDAVPDELAASGMVLSFTDFLKLGDAVDDVTLDARTAEAKVENCVTLIYTSGTTGNPKAVMASHDAMLYSAAVVTDFIKFKIERMISYLPLSHIAAQLLDIFIPMFQCAESDVPLVMHFARPDVLKGSLPVTLQMVRPDVFFGVPRVWEKFCEGIKAKAKAAPATGVKKRLVDFAKDVGLRASYARQVGGDGYIPRGYNIAKTLVHAKVRDALGLDKCRLALTSAAPIQRETLEFLASLGIDVCETFGMSETCGMGTVSLPFRFKFGSCGWPKPTMEMKTDHVEGRDKPGEGEICFRGRHVMMGYLRNEEKSRETIDPEGWLHSGDVGRFDEDHQLYITGRIKELIIGAGGENIAPVPIEDIIKRNLPALSNVVMIGNNRKYNVVLVTLKCRPDLETGAFFPDLAGEALDVNPAVKTVAAAIADPTWQTYITKGIEAYNKIAVSNAQKIQKFAILPTDLSVPGGELTGTLKLKRNVVAEKYAAVIDGLYAGGDE